MKLFSKKEIHKHVMMNEISGAFSYLTRKDVRMPIIMRMDIPENNGEMVVKNASIPRHDIFSLKVSTDF